MRYNFRLGVITFAYFQDPGIGILPVPRHVLCDNIVWASSTKDT